MVDSNMTHMTDEDFVKMKDNIIILLIEGDSKTEKYVEKLNTDVTNLIQELKAANVKIEFLEGENKALKGKIVGPEKK
jgi:hypothetical protein